MLDIKFIKENPDLIKEAVRKKHLSFNVDDLLALEEKRATAQKTFEMLRTEQNTLSDEIPKATDQAVRAKLIEDLKPLKEKVQAAEEEAKTVMKEWQLLMLQVPNVPDMSVPEGVSDEENLEHRVWGEKPVFDFDVKDHVALMEARDMVDFDRGTKVAGFRGYFLKGDAVLLQFALWQYFMQAITAKGFAPIVVPSLVNKQTLYGTGYLPQGEEDLYKTQDDDYLAGTAEVATMSYHSDEVLALSDLPKKYVAFSPCFRREAGSHGKDVKGLIRVHEFYKLEQVVLCEANHETSVALHEEITNNVEELLQAMGLHYHIVINCGGDLGLGQVKKYDIEVWMPSQQKFRETHSASYFHDFQTRRLNIRYKDAEGKLRYAHSLNNTLVATPSRIIPAIIENFQEADGRIRVPDVLKPYIGKDYLG
ncbi:MAG: serine--tRNA ligase [Candidatus Pacebacteria bacterium]|jgi:seryl-tRNA synthetase|nr:serine--tRNA ligase [Candidatus Paceibacterota bacterium]MBP9701017.1 serine--tRNA ligase [Candidatus Paceibacterota bacterium]